LTARLPQLPVHSREAVAQELETLDFLDAEINSAEKRLNAIMAVSVEADLLITLPSVGAILSMTLMLEIANVERFPTAEHLSSLFGVGVARAFEWWSYPYGAGQWKRESKSEVGLCGNRQT
jgi:transposase